MSKRVIWVAVCTLAVLALWAALPSSKETDAVAEKRAAAQAAWRDMCARADCDGFPLGYATYNVGPEVYYFPQIETMEVRPPSLYAGGVKPGTYLDIDEAGRLRRSVSNGAPLHIANCCHYLLTFYGLADAFPLFAGNGGLYERSTFSLDIGPHDTDYADRLIRREFGLSPQTRPVLDDLLETRRATERRNFWMLENTRSGETGERSFAVLTKDRPLMNRRVVIACGRLCTVSTVGFADDPPNTLPHVTWRWMTIDLDAAYDCPPQDDCALNDETLDKFTLTLDLIDRMFAAAQILPDDHPL